MTGLSWPDGPGILVYPDGRTIRGRSLRRPWPAGPEPEFAAYLTARDPGPFAWDYRWVRWSDFRTPASTDETVAALRDAFQRAATQRVEVACPGGVGRTGSALAALAVLAGVPAAEAVGWVRSRYHKRAVETPGQRRWVVQLEGLR